MTPDSNARASTPDPVMLKHDVRFDQAVRTDVDLMGPVGMGKFHDSTLSDPHPQKPEEWVDPDLAPE